MMGSVAFLAAAGLAAIFWPTRSGNPPVVAVALTPVLQGTPEMLDPSKLNLEGKAPERAEHHSTVNGSFGDVPAAAEVSEFPSSPLEPRAGFNDFPEAYDAPIVRANSDEKGFDDNLKKSSGQEQSGNGNYSGGGRRYGASSGFGGSMSGGGGAGGSGMGRAADARESAPIVVPANNQRLIVAAETSSTPRASGGSGSSASFDPNEPFGDSDLSKAANKKVVIDPSKLVGQSVSGQHMPEPGSLLLLAGGGAAAGARAWKKRRSRS